MGLEGHLDRLGCSSTSPSPARADMGQETVSSSRRCPPEMVSQQAGGTPCSGPAIAQGGVLLLCLPVPRLSPGCSAPRHAVGRGEGCRLLGVLLLAGEGVLPAAPRMWVCAAARKQLIFWAQPWLSPMPGKKRC